MKTAIVTGATGFVGSALTANLLADGFRVLAVSRDDEAGHRTLAAVREAASGFSMDIETGIAELLQTIDAGQGTLADAITEAHLCQVDVVWHCAAEMSYSPKKLEYAFRVNVCGTANLYRKVAASGRCKRFYYVSTAYTAGLRGGDTAEKLHVGNPCVNSYQISKLCAEQSLFILHGEHALPLTIFRPTIVVGHSRTGWARRNGFGMYMFADVIAAASQAGLTTTCMNLPPLVRPDLVTVDRLVADMVGLTLRNTQGSGFEVFQCAGSRQLTTQQVVSTIGATLGVRVTYGTPLTSLDQRIDRAIDRNRPFASTDWTFSRSKLDAALGHPPGPPIVDEAMLGRLVRWYQSDNPCATGDATAAEAVAETSL
ncbi:SDR family NAD(P)-dependent oxidoreductase [Paraburkholderia dilworthii]|uniref:SDR family NAD(P)-dependent oxidoreductase n=1 Tax=Paraburkholderia dilworthii TaxID=948106 RepID=UPI0003FE4E1D|nr:SDR family NAD(P)-dependent oxidoreductase [Paraburkholderia dilworthii]